MYWLLFSQRLHLNLRTNISALEWCIEHWFELVELNPEPDPEWEEEEEDFVETTGIERVVQAMHAHRWPNLQMKGKGTFKLHVFLLPVWRI